MIPYARRRGELGSRWRSVSAILLGVAVVAALPAALAFACVPGGSLSFSQVPYRYQAGESVGVRGSGFHAAAVYKLSMESPSGAVTPVGDGLAREVRTDSGGGFQDTIKIPAAAAPGNYVVRGETTGPGGGGMDNGTAPVTRVQRETFEVVPKPAATPPAPMALAPAASAPFAGKTINGTSGPDKLVGTPFNDVITCGGGNDVVKGGGGNDVINCGAGKDRVDGGPGRDRVVGGAGNDKLSGGSGNDKLYGSAGKDTLRGGKGTDMLFGGGGNDRLYRDGADLLRGGGGRNSVVSVTKK